MKPLPSLLVFLCGWLCLTGALFGQSSAATANANATASAPGAAPKIYLIGDSTMADKGTALPEWGWGMGFRKFVLDPAQVQNHAKNGRSSKSFIDEGLWEVVRNALQPGDFVIVQFGHNDEKTDPARHTDPATSYRDNLRTFIRETREHGAHPLLATPISRRKFDPAGRLLDTHGAYPDAVRAVAAEEKVPLLDLQRATAEWLQKTGPEPAKKFFMWIEPGVYPNRPDGVKDDTHLVEAGATRVAALAAAEIREQKLPLARWLIDPAAAESLADETSARSKAPGFSLADAAGATAILVDPETSPQIRRAIGDFADDVERVSGKKPKIITQLSDAPQRVVIIGQIGASRTIDALISAGKLEVSGVKGEWESHVVQGVDQPLAGVKQALVIAGSDPRGTIFGVYGLSERIGVSPWYWWADVPVPHHDEITVFPGLRKQGPPAVKYRGIFLNDEDWGLQPWAAKTFEPEVGDIGPKTYAKICELLLRLRANCLWPAMHPSTRAFNYYPQNKLVADAYGIVMGSSHAEPMLRNNVDEWHRDGHGDYNYVTNREGVLKYWEERVRTNGKFENLYTVGMRGIHDSGMPGGGSLEEKALRLTQIISDQRDLLKKWTGRDPKTVPQIFCPYKEVLAIYQHMPSLPDDITLVWPDDNYGYVRRFSNEQERQRSGGAGVYYHVSYWGSPTDYLWLSSTAPALIWEEMSKAYRYGARNVWIVNVGDLKPAEINAEFFLDLAWHPLQSPPETVQRDFLRAFAERTFGTDHAEEIAAILDRYYVLNFSAKPEYMGLDVAQLPGIAPEFSVESGGPAEQRLIAFSALRQQADLLAKKLPAEQQDAFFELVLYPVRGATEINEKALNLALYLDAKKKGEADADHFLEAARSAYAAIQRETNYYNQTLQHGKWAHVMSASPRNQPAFRAPDETLAKLAEDTAKATSGKESANAPRTQSSPLDSLERRLQGGRAQRIEAEFPSRMTQGSEAFWRRINGVGENGAAMLIAPIAEALPMPVRAAVPSKPAPVLRALEPSDFKSAPSLEYKVKMDHAGSWEVVLRALPTWPVDSRQPSRIAVAVDDEAPQIVSWPAYSEESNLRWRHDVMANATLLESTHPIGVPGEHVVKIWMQDPDVVLDALYLTPGE